MVWAHLELTIFVKLLLFVCLHRSVVPAPSSKDNQDKVENWVKDLPASQPSTIQQETTPTKGN